MKACIDQLKIYHALTMYSHYATPEQVKEIHDRVSRYKYGYLRKLHKYTHISYCRLSIMVRSERITHHAYTDILQACKRFEKKFG